MLYKIHVVNFLKTIFDNSHYIAHSVTSLLVLLSKKKMFSALAWPLLYIQKATFFFFNVHQLDIILHIYRP